MAIFDMSHRNLYVANTGDCRAVAGVWIPSANGDGAWSVDVLTEDQTGRNPKELARFVAEDFGSYILSYASERIQSEHPADEKDDVVKRGRILGGLEPSRAFGDARYKWPFIVQAT
jgi:pyruvate dehydrogenase phosphatase